MIHNLYRINAAAADRFINPWSGENDATGVGGSGPYLFYPPRDINLYTGCIARAAASGAGTAVITDYVNGTEGGTSTGTVTLSDPATSVRTAFTGSWPASVGATTAAGKHIDFSITGAPAGEENQITYVYQDDTIPGLSWYGFGSRTDNILSGVAATNDRFITAGINGVVGASSETAVQVPWPLAGTFQYVGMVYSIAAGSGSVTLALRKNGADTAITFTLVATAGAATQVTDSSLTATVAAGDLINWRYQQASGTGNFTCVLVWGFVAS